MATIRKLLSWRRCKAQEPSDCKAQELSDEAVKENAKRVGRVLSPLAGMTLLLGLLLALGTVVGA